MKPYKNNDYIDDIFELSQMEFSLESIEKASVICDGLRSAMTNYQLRWMSRAGIAFICFLCFMAGIAIGSMVA